MRSIRTIELPLTLGLIALASCSGPAEEADHTSTTDLGGVVTGAGGQGGSGPRAGGVGGAPGASPIPEGGASGGEPAEEDATAPVAPDAGSPSDSGAKVVSKDAGAFGFVHPGVLVNLGMLDFVKKQAAAGVEPSKGALAKAMSSNLGSRSYTPHPYAVVECGPTSMPDIGCTEEKADATASYTQALLWYYTGDKTYAENSIKIMNAWSSTVQGHTNSNAPLQSAWAAESFPRAAEIIRHTNAGWSDADSARFAKMLKEVYLPKLINGSDSNGNWELSMIEAVMNIGVFTDDRATFDKGVQMWRQRVPAYVYVSSDGARPVGPPRGAKTGAALTGFWYNQSTMMDGLAQETCRDLGHVQYGLASIVNAAETAAIQGIDLYGEQLGRISAGLELHAKYINGASVPGSLCGGRLTDVSASPMWEIGYNAIAVRLGKPLPETLKVVQRIRPTSTDHHMAWETLTHGGIGKAGLE